MTNEELYLKSRITNENPFRVPEGYFDRLTADVMARLPERQSENPKEEKTARRIQLRRSWLAAASVAVVAIVGTLVYASYGKLEPEEIPALLERGDRRLTGPTMPPQGLYLNRVWYPEPVNALFEEA